MRGEGVKGEGEGGECCLVSGESEGVRGEGVRGEGRVCGWLPQVVCRLFVSWFILVVVFSVSDQRQLLLRQVCVFRIITQDRVICHVVLGFWSHDPPNYCRCVQWSQKGQASFAQGEAL